MVWTVAPCETYIFSLSGQSLKATILISVTDGGMPFVSVVRLVQSEKAAVPIVCRLEGSVTVCKAVHDLKVSNCARAVRAVPDKSTIVSAEASMKAAFPMLLTLAGIVIVLRVVHWK